MELSTLKQAFEQFRRECVWLQRCYNTHCTLFDQGSEVDELLMLTAGNFFYDLSRILQEYILQRICALTDPPKSGSSKNLCVKLINQGLAKHGLLTSSMTEVSGRIDGYRNLVVAARNKGLSHFDLTVLLSGETLGEHAPEEVEQFYADIQIYNDEVGEVLEVGQLDFRATPAEGDALDLISILRKCADNKL